MVNKLVTAAAIAFERNAKIEDLPSFWRAFGRDDLQLVERHDELVGAPALQSVLYFAKATIARRIKTREPEEVIDLGGGATARVIRKDRSRPTPLTNFMIVGPDGRTRYWHLRPTKGWVGGVVDEFEVNAWARQGVKTLGTLPKTSRFARLRRRAFEALRRIA